jgi:hypothetical protein
VLAWVAVGFLVPPAFFVAFAAFLLLQDTLLGHVALALALGLCALWPGGLLLLAFEGVPQVLWPTLVASVVANVALYAFAGVVVRRLLARSRRRLPAL